MIWSEKVMLIVLWQRENLWSSEGISCCSILVMIYYLLWNLLSKSHLKQALYEFSNVSSNLIIIQFWNVQYLNPTSNLLNTVALKYYGVYHVICEHCHSSSTLKLFGCLNSFRTRLPSYLNLLHKSFRQFKLKWI